MNPEAMADAKGQPRPGLPTVQSVSRVKQDPHMEADHHHDTKMGFSVQAFNMRGRVLWTMGAKLPMRKSSVQVVRRGNQSVRLRLAFASGRKKSRQHVANVLPAAENTARIRTRCSTSFTSSQ